MPVFLPIKTTKALNLSPLVVASSPSSPGDHDAPAATLPADFPPLVVASSPGITTCRPQHRLPTFQRLKQQTVLPPFQVWIQKLSCNIMKHTHPNIRNYLIWLMFQFNGEIVEAVIDEVSTRYSWYYISCSKDNCKKQIICRYKVKLEISDPTASASCVLFDKEAKQLINEPAENMVVSSSNESNELPRPIQAINIPKCQAKASLCFK